MINNMVKGTKEINETKRRNKTNEPKDIEIINRSKGINKIGGMILGCLFWLVLWQLVAMAVDSTLLLPSPIETAAALGDLAMTTDFYADVAWTIFRCILAMLLSFVLGVLAAWISYKIEVVRSLLVLPVGFFKAVPVMAVVIYLILLMQSDWVGVAACFLMCFPIVYTNVLTGLDAVSSEFLELAEIYRLSVLQVMRLIYVPSIMPQIKAAVKLIAGLSWKAVVAAEVLSIPAHSLGYGMMNAKYYLETPTLFAYVIVIIALSMTMEKIINLCLEGLDAKGYEGSKLCKISKTVADEPKSSDSMALSKGSEVSNGSRVSDYDITAEILSKNVECKSTLGDLTTLAPRIEIKSLLKAFDNNLVLNDVTKTFEAGKVSILKGPSGSGKTTLVRILAGLETADFGEIKFVFDHGIVTSTGSDLEFDGGTNFDFALDSESASKHDVKLAYLFQEDRLLPWLNVYDNMALSLAGKQSSHIAENKSSDSSRLVANKSSNGDVFVDDVMEMARALELEDALWKLPGELSGGMKHRVALGRTFLADANVVILDEPLRGLDDGLKTRIVDRLWESQTKDKTVILITHNEQDLELLDAEQ